MTTSKGQHAGFQLISVEQRRGCDYSCDVRIEAEHIRSSALRLAAVCIALSTLNLAVFIGILAFEVVLLGPLLLPAVMFAIGGLWYARAAFRGAAVAKSADIDVVNDELRVSGERWQFSDVRIERRPYELLVWCDTPSGYVSLPWAQKKGHMTPFARLFVDSRRADKLVEMLSDAGAVIDDRRAVYRWIVPGIYGLVLALALVMVTLRALAFGGLWLVVEGSNELGATTGVHPAAIFLGLAAVVALVMLARCLRRS